MLMANCMTASDLCSMYKPWKLQLELVHVIMEEFWIQVNMNVCLHSFDRKEDWTLISKRLGGKSFGCVDIDIERKNISISGDIGG